jgi:hypothetical protein
MRCINHAFVGRGLPARPRPPGPAAGDTKKSVAGHGRKIICEDVKGWRWETY